MCNLPTQPKLGQGARGHMTLAPEKKRAPKEDLIPCFVQKTNLKIIAKKSCNGTTQSENVFVNFVILL